MTPSKYVSHTHSPKHAGMHWASLSSGPRVLSNPHETSHPPPLPLYAIVSQLRILATKIRPAFASFLAGAHAPHSIVVMAPLRHSPGRIEPLMASCTGGFHSLFHSPSQALYVSNHTPLGNGALLHFFLSNVVAYSRHQPRARR